jgi:large subunit ribosomal protein L21
MKKAVIETGGKQYIVGEGQEVKVELLDEKIKYFDALAIIDGKNTKVGTPFVKDVRVTFKVIEQAVKQDKVTALRYKAKKRVSIKRGHRQLLAVIKIDKIQ